MTQQSFEQRFVVARVLNRYAAESTELDWNKPLVAALEKWIAVEPKTRGTCSPRHRLSAFGPTAQSA